MSVRRMAGVLAISAVFGWGTGTAAPGAEPAGRRDTHENLHAVLWMQTSAEYQAITRGLYHLAAAQLDRALERDDRRIDVGAALESRRGFGLETEDLARAAHGVWFEIRAFERHHLGLG